MARKLTDEELQRRMDRARERGELRGLGLDSAPGSMAAFNKRERERRERDEQFEDDERKRLAGGWDNFTIGEKNKAVNRAVDVKIKQFDRLYRAVRDVRKIGGDFRPALAAYNKFCSYFFDIRDEEEEEDDRATRILMRTRSRIINRLIDFNAKYYVMAHNPNAFPRRLNKRGRDSGIDYDKVPNNAYEINPSGFPQALGFPQSPTHVGSPLVGGQKAYFRKSINLFGEYDYKALIARGRPFLNMPEKFEDIMARYILALQTNDVRAESMETYYNLKIPRLAKVGADIFVLYKQNWEDNRFADFSDPATYVPHPLPPDLEIRDGRVVLTWNIGEKTPPPPAPALEQPTPIQPPRTNQQQLKRDNVKDGNPLPVPKRHESGGSNSSDNPPIVPGGQGIRMQVDPGTLDLLEKLNLKY